MAIPIRRQVIEVEGRLLGVVTGLSCPHCDEGYAELRIEPVNINRTGIPAPFVAPTWGEKERREEIAADLATS